MLESACLPVPSEVIMLFAGYLVSIHSMSLTAAVAAGVAGNVVGSWIAWGVGMSGGRGGGDASNGVKHRLKATASAPPDPSDPSGLR